MEVIKMLIHRAFWEFNYRNGNWLSHETNFVHLKSYLRTRSTTLSVYLPNSEALKIAKPGYYLNYNQYHKIKSADFKCEHQFHPDF